jgi:hypothetical protein
LESNRNPLLFAPLCQSFRTLLICHNSKECIYIYKYISECKTLSTFVMISLTCCLKSYFPSIYCRIMKIQTEACNGGVLVSDVNTGNMVKEQRLPA